MIEEPVAKVRWPHIENSPHHVQHLRDLVGRLETPMMPNTKAAVLACLDELLRRLNSQNIVDVGRAGDGASPAAKTHSNP